MAIFVHILSHNIVPIFILIFLGYATARRFALDIFTLSKLTFYIFVPLFVFSNLYSAVIPLEMLKVVIYTVALIAVNMTISSIVGRRLGYDISLRSAFKNCVVFYNSGNIGVPLITLVFSSAPFAAAEAAPYLELALTTQIVVMSIQNVILNTLGFYNAGRAHLAWQESLLNVLKLPTTYVIPLAFAARALPWDLQTSFVWPALAQARNGLVPVALLALGIQLTRTRIELADGKTYLAAGLRLIGGPIVAYGLIQLLGLDGVIAHALIISAATPSAVNTALIAVEYNNCPDFASRAVMSSTLLSALTLTIVIYTARLLFPLPPV